MTASPATIQAVQEALGCKPYDGVWNAFKDPCCDVHGEYVWTDRGCPVAVKVADAAARVVAAETPAARGIAERWEYGVERPWGMEWGASVGMSHRYEYTAESVHALADGRPVWRRLRTSFSDVIGEPELFEREP